MTSQPDILLIRHGETQWNVSGRLQGRRDTPLTVNGVRQVLAVATQLQDRVESLPRRRYWVSPLGRARQTASILAGVWGVPFDLFAEEPALVERAYGVWEGRTVERIREEYEDQHRSFQADRWSYAMPEGESQSDVARRLKDWYESLDREHVHVVVTHSGCFRILRGLATGAPNHVVLTYREPQTTSAFLSGGQETLLDVPPAVLRAFQCEGQGRTVAI